MLGLPLIYEMALVAILICLIGWLMGRILCKSNEYEIRAANKALQAAHERLESLLVRKGEEIHQLTQRLQAGQQAMAESRHQQTTVESLFAKLQQEHQASLATIQELTAYRTQFEALGNAHDAQSRQVISQQETLRQTRDDMAKAIARGAEQRTMLEAAVCQCQEEKRNADALIAEQQTALATYRQQQQELENAAEARNKLIAQLQQQNADLQAVNRQQCAAIDTLNAKINGYLQSVDSTNRRISSMLETLPVQG